MPTLTHTTPLSMLMPGCCPAAMAGVHLASAMANEPFTSGGCTPCSRLSGHDGSDAHDLHQHRKERPH